MAVTSFCSCTMFCCNCVFSLCSLPKSVRVEEGKEMDGGDEWIQNKDEE